jgi:hypothetical protein
MHFFFDEAGTFTVPRDQSLNRTGIVVGLAVPEDVLPTLEKRFLDFTSTLEKDERVDGEPKGYRLCVSHRKSFASLMARFRSRISLTPVTLDLSTLQGHHADPRSSTAAAVRAWIPQMKYAPAKEGLRLLASQIENLSANQMLRLYTLAQCFHEAIQHAILFLSFGEHEGAWENLTFEIDRVHQKANSREERVFSGTIAAWLAAWGEKRPITLIKEVHRDDLPVIRKYASGEFFDIGAMLQGNISWADSRDRLGIQIVDFAAAIIADATYESGDVVARKTYEKLMRTCGYGPARGPGLITFDPTNPLVAQRFEPLAVEVAQRELRERARLARRLGARS